MVRATLLGALLAASIATAQQAVPATQMLDTDVLRQTGESLLKQARGAESGLAFTNLIARPESTLQMAVRTRSGQAEWHRDAADLLIALEGSAVVVTGGKVVNGRDTAPGEIRGDSVADGTRHAFHPGDILRVEPGTPHQFLLEPGTTIRYLAVKSKPGR